MDISSEARKIYNALEPLIIETVKEATKSCVRAKQMMVATSPSSGKIGVSEYGSDNVFQIPYFGRAGNLSVGDSVWVRWFFSDFSTAEAFDDVTITSGTELPPIASERDVFILLGS